MGDSDPLPSEVFPISPFPNPGRIDFPCKYQQTMVSAMDSERWCERISQPSTIVYQENQPKRGFKQATNGTSLTQQRRVQTTQQRVLAFNISDSRACVRGTITPRLQRSSEICPAKKGGTSVWVCLLLKHPQTWWCFPVVSMKSAPQTGVPLYHLKEPSILGSPPFPWIT